MHDATGAAEDAYLAMHDEWREGEYAAHYEMVPVVIVPTHEAQMHDFGNRLTYYLETWDGRAWTAPGPWTR